MSLMRRLGAALVLLALVAGVPTVLVALTGAPHIMGLELVSQLRDAFAGTDLLDQSQLLVHGLALIAWIAWLQFAVAVVIETGAAVRGWSMPEIPTLRVSQRLAGGLISAIISVGPGTVAMAHTNSPATAAPLPYTSTRPAATVVFEAPVDANSPIPGASWAPSPTAPTQTVEHVVIRGDTLWSIAEHYYDDGTQSQRIFEDNRATVQPDGRRLTRPSMIRPGWVLTLHEVPVAQAPREQPPATDQGTPGSEAPADEAAPAAPPATPTPAEPANSQPAATTPATPPTTVTSSATPTIPPTTAADQPPATVTPTDPSSTPLVPIDPAQLEPQPSTTTASTPEPSTTVQTAPTATPATPHDDDQAGPVDDVTAPTSVADAPVSDAAAELEEESSVAAPATAVALLSAAILALVWRLRRRTEAERPVGAVPAFDPPPDVEDMLRSAADSAALDDVDRALRALANGLAERGDAPAIQAVTVSDAKVTALLAEPDENAPAPWVAGRGGQVWSVARPVETPAEGPRLLPALVTMGRADNTPLILLNLEHAGVVSLAGHTSDRIDTMRTMALELAISPLADAIHVLCVGFAGELAGFERVTVVDELADAEAIIERHATDAAEAAADGLSPITGRAQELGDWTTWAPLVVFAPNASAAECDELLAAAYQSGEGGVLAVVTAQDVTAPFELEVTATTIKLPTLDAVLGRRNITEEDAAGVWHLIEDARTTETESALERETHAYGTVTPFPSHTVADYEHDVDGELAVVLGHDNFEPSAGDIDLRDSHDDSGSKVEGEDLPWLDHDWTLNVLGPVELRRADGEPEAFGGRGGKWPVLTYLAWHRAGVTWDALFEAAWPGETPKDPRRRVSANVEPLRRGLGLDSVNGELHLPNLASNGQGRYVLGRRVITDWEQFQAFARWADAHPEGRDRALRAALELVRGEPFEGSRIPWVEGSIDQQLRRGVTSAARSLAQAALDAGRHDDVEWAALGGLSAEKYDSALHRLRLQAAIADGDAHRVDDVWRHYVACVSDDDELVESNSDLDPEIVALYQAYRRRNPLNWAQTAG